MRRNSATSNRAHKAFKIDMRNTVTSAVGQRKRQLRTFRKGIKGYESPHTDRRYRGAQKLLTAKIESRPDEARNLCDTFKSKFADGVVVFAAVSGDKLNFVSAAGADAVKAGAHAGNILKDISAICGGKGGGRPDSAMSGGRDLDKIDEALVRVEQILASI